MLKPVLKKIFRHPLTLSFLAWLVAKYMWVVYKTNRWEYLHKEKIEAFWNSGKPMIACFWHNRLGMMTFSWQTNSPFYMLISKHADGQVISESIQHHGIQVIEGSTSKGTPAAVRQLIKVLKQGHSVGVTPDGPRGPRYSVNTGLIQLAAKIGVDIVPASYSTTRRKVISSWDRLIIPLPFGKGLFIVGDPIPTRNLTNEKEIEETAKLLRERLITISNEADAYCGQTIIPAPEGEYRHAS